ncbi:amino acid/amide ABC transporter ATP-binding protein 2 (HAAT family) [Chelatococcus asaccharovorans]|uniref:Amino acid/amide ABC transporter ATP-binding protein 2 (HAAT family) n=2 Tax=Chelatococcus asaccharovorans TaxID=28210 RepID=A0A2V3TUX8_9HYPH|nr:amino acid/amide ABC transporter ATP-binding protein 2 (HAAT family) [Chelatococcus asaccharovorans]
MPLPLAGRGRGWEPLGNGRIKINLPSFVAESVHRLPSFTPTPYPSPQGGGAKALAMLTVDAIDLHYGAAQALRGVSLAAETGKVTCVLGRNGVGKTSLLRAIVGQQPISHGAISLDGQDLKRLPPYERARRGIAFVPQGREIFPLLSVRENLETGFAPLKRRDQSIPEDIFNLFPVLKDMLHRRGGDLSGGQQQQLAIGRALVTRPRLLVLDEPTEGIQPSVIKDIGRAIDYLRNKGDMAILLVEQYFEFARDLCDSFAVMERGQVVLAGTRAEMVDAEVRRKLSV